MRADMTPEIKRLRVQWEQDHETLRDETDKAERAPYGYAPPVRYPLTEERAHVEQRLSVLNDAADALDGLMAWAGEMRAYLPQRAKDDIDAAEEALERLRGETP